MIQIADVIPQATPIQLSNGVIYAAMALYFIDRVVSIGTSLAQNRKDVMSRAEIEKEHARLQNEISQVDMERREVSEKIFGKIDVLGNSVAAGMNDVARALGKLEGTHEIAHTIKAAMENCVRHNR